MRRLVVQIKSTKKKDMESLLPGELGIAKGTRQLIYCIDDGSYLVFDESPLRRLKNRLHQWFRPRRP